MNIWLLVRIAGIVAGIAMLLRVATDERLVTYDPLFLAWMDWLTDIVEFGFLTKLIEPFLHWGIDWMRSFGFSLPDLQDEWRPAWVLSFLLFASIARHSSWRLGWPLAVAGALAAATVGGLTGDLIAALGLAVGSAIATERVLGAAGVIAALLGSTAALGVGFIFGGVTLGSVAFTCAAALMYSGWVESHDYGWRAVVANPRFNIGLDILFAMTSAFALAASFANPPIW